MKCRKFFPDEILFGKVWDIVAEIEKQNIHTTRSATLKIQELIKQEVKEGKCEALKEVKEVLKHYREAECTICLGMKKDIEKAMKES